LLDSMDMDGGMARMAAVQFARGVRDQNAIHFKDYTTNKEAREAILDIDYSYPDDQPDFNTLTETGLGIDYAVEKFLPEARAEATKAIVVLTDGKSNYDGRVNHLELTTQAADRARKYGATVFAVGIGHSECVDNDAECEPWANRLPSECEVNPHWMKINCRKSCNTCEDKDYVDETELHQIAGSQSHVFRAADYKSLDQIKDILTAGICYEVVQQTKAQERKRRDKLERTVADSGH